VHLVGWAVDPRGAWPYCCVKAVQPPCPGAAASVMAVLLATVGGGGLQHRPRPAAPATVAAVETAAMLVV
tara:strand:+ start:2634 stop:2843 length:210 start_codon:yes stop_codon:yes gene_type:complete